MSKRKFGTHYDFPATDSSDDEAGTQRRAAPEQILRETTHVGIDGSMHHTSSMVAVPASPTEQRADDTTFLNPDIKPAPVFDLLEDADDTGGRELRDSDDPLRQWVANYRDLFLETIIHLEGRGDHRSYSVCASCRVDKADHRCHDCMSGGELICKDCMVVQHRTYPLHRVEYWTGTFFEKKSLKELGLRIQLGHWVGRNHKCTLPQPAAGDVFVIVDESGVHEVNLDFCGCGTGGAPPLQLLRARLYPATVVAPRTAATFNILDGFELLAYESKCSAYEYYHSLARRTDNTGLNTPPDRYHEFRRMTHEWNNLHMLERAGRQHDPAGISGTEPGGCALLCLACPQPGKNLPDDWRDAPVEKQFLYALFLAMDANFQLKRKDVSSEEKDPGLGDGWSFYCAVVEYMEHVKLHWDKPQERSTCVAHDAVDKPDREARGTASSGIGAVDCARHNMKRPLGVGDLQFGKRYINMDYIFFKSLEGTKLMRFYMLYDIACQWHVNIWNRMKEYNSEIQILDDMKFMVFLVPKFHLPAHIEACNLRFSFNLTRDVGQTDGEAPERGWANANPLAGSTKEMGPGARSDTLNEHFNDWNWKKIIAFGRVMHKKTLKAVPEMVGTKRVLDDMEVSLGAAGVDEDVEAVEVWTKMATLWEEDPDEPNPFETREKDAHLATGDEEDADLVDDMHVMEMIAMGLQLEEQQRALGFDAAAVGLHPTEDQRRTMLERTSKLRRKIETWMKCQEHFIPRVIWLRQKEDAVRARSARTQLIPGVKVQEIPLWMPFAMMKLPEAQQRPRCTKEVQAFEYRLRVGQAHEALHDIQRQLLVRSHMYKYKDKSARGVQANTRSNQKIGALNDQIRRAAAQYRVARLALVSLGRALEKNEWELTLKELKPEDVRGRPRQHFGDEEHQSASKRKPDGEQGRKKKRKVGPKPKPRRKELPLSWIWVVQTKTVVGEKQALNEALRIEWAKTRARSLRWYEEVSLLEGEMRRILQFLRWHEGWWLEQVGRRGLSDGAQLEGETAYTVRQAKVQRDLHDSFSQKWRDLPELIQRGRAGEDVREDDGWEDESDSGSNEEGGSGSEVEPIPDKGGRPIRTMYVDV
ncbi:hypothetical protein DFH09DRAFT_1074071 [Mycena vulgaris]|nr:hypothetical protein DFH09DRAFT_1074071 [Mycena vulgaris]